MPDFKTIVVTKEGYIGGGEDIDLVVDRNIKFLPGKNIKIIRPTHSLTVGKNFKLETCDNKYAVEIMPETYITKIYNNGIIGRQVKNEVEYGIVLNKSEKKSISTMTDMETIFEQKGQDERGNLEDERGNLVQDINNCGKFINIKVNVTFRGSLLAGFSNDYFAFAYTNSDNAGLSSGTLSFTDSTTGDEYVIYFRDNNEKYKNSETGFRNCSFLKTSGPSTIINITQNTSKKIKSGNLTKLDDLITGLTAPPTLTPPQLPGVDITTTAGVAVQSTNTAVTISSPSTSTSVVTSTSQNAFVGRVDTTLTTAGSAIAKQIVPALSLGGANIDPVFRFLVIPAYNSSTTSTLPGFVGQTTSTVNISKKPQIGLLGGVSLGRNGFKGSVAGGATYQNTTFDTTINLNGIPLTPISGTSTNWAPTLDVGLGYWYDIYPRLSIGVDLDYLIMSGGPTTTGNNAASGFTVTSSAGSINNFTATGGVRFRF